MEFYVEHRIEVDADSPEEAARLARKIQRDPTSTATVFHVVGEDGELSEMVPIDLENDDGDLIAATTFSDIVEQARELLPDDGHPEYMRGICELIAMAFPVWEVPTDVRADQIKDMIRDTGAEQ